MIAKSLIFICICRAFEDEKKAKMGVTECARHELLNAYPVLYDKDGEFVAQIKYTVLLMPNGPLRYLEYPYHIIALVFL